MQRKFRRFTQIDRKKIEQRNDAFRLEKKEDDFLVVHTEEAFREKCLNNPEKKIIHLLIDNKDNRNNFLWQKSSGPTSSLSEYLIKTEECKESIDENKILIENKEKVLILSTEPGMGKTSILDHFTQNSSAEEFFLKIILKTCKKALSDANFEENLKMSSNDLIEFVLTSLLNKKDQQEIALLKHLAKEEKLILMFEGLDEVNDCKEKVIHLIDALDKDENYKLKKILITTRNHLKQDLEDHFKTFSFNLNNFNYEDQIEFLYKYWLSSNKNHQESVDKLMQSAVDLINKIKYLHSENLNRLIGIPLQTKMLADIFIDKEKDFSKIEISNIADLYKEFIEKKIKIKYEERSKSAKIEELPEEVKQFLFDYCYSIHIKLSSKLLFEDNNAMSYDVLNKEEKIQEILEYGVIVGFEQNKTPIFLHQSFAEFFLAKSSLNKIEQNKGDPELQQILRDQNHFLIRKFLNDLMQKNSKNEKQTTRREKEDFKTEIENCCRENLISLLEYFISENEENLKTENKFLILAAKNGNKDIVEYLIEKGVDINQQVKSVNNLSSIVKNLLSLSLIELIKVKFFSDLYFIYLILLCKLN
jgi:hypothetical protein